MKLRQAVKWIGAVGAFWAFAWGMGRHPNETVLILIVVASLLASRFIFVMATGPDE